MYLKHLNYFIPINRDLLNFMLKKFGILFVYIFINLLLKKYKIVDYVDYKIVYLFFMPCQNE